MKFLQAEFEQDLLAEIDDSGAIRIGESLFSPVDILSSDQEAYENELTLWRSEVWLPPKLEKLKKILELENNQHRFADLLELLLRNKVVPFVGSGMSASSSMPMWTKFLWQLQTQSTLAATDLQAMIDAGNYEDAASALIANMPNPLFNEKLEQTFRARQLDNVVGAVKYLPRIFASTVVTTNYDNILELVFQDLEIEFDEILFGKRIEDHSEFRRNEQRCLLKLHGDFRRPSTRVLTKPEYDSCYQEGSAFKAELSLIYQANSLLFLGCSLQNDRTVSLLAEVASRDPTMPRHYAFLASPDTPEDRIRREHFLTDRKIFPIWYPVLEHNHDEPIEALLIGLMQGLGKI